ncbi:MAG: hypothetical protein H8D67_27300 [Deltaproteobacteria bacterium]|nr:hypothetical protein [Deltaproteobacteria bacterium]
MPDVEPHDIEKTIKAIQNIAIILTGATEYVCEGRMLKRFSKDIEANLDKLEADIASLKKKLPGKAPETLETDSPLSKIRDIATILGGDNGDIEAKCRAGDLGNEFIISVIELKGTVKDIGDTVTGKVSEYTFTDRIADYGGRVKSFLLSISPLVSNIGRVILAAILVAIFSFVYLSLTMESEDVLLKSIKDDLSYIEAQKDAIGKHRQEYEEIKKKLKVFDQGNRELIRQDTIEMLSLSSEESKIRELIEKTLFSIETKEKEIAEKNKKVEEIRKKSFFQKLLRR